MNYYNQDRENLLPLSNQRNTNDNCGNLSRSNGYYSSNGFRTQFRKNLILFVISLLIATCLTVYVYLNYTAINATNLNSEANLQASNKPLSRRKPMLDHESIFSESGPSLIKLTDLMAHCVVALKAGGRKVVEMSLKNKQKLSDIGSKGKTREGVDDVVTGADLESHNIILNTIKDSYRRLKVVSEEDTTKAFENIHLNSDILPMDRVEFAHQLRQISEEFNIRPGHQWPLISQHETLVWIDPLDATKEYSENLTEYVTLMGCIVHKSVPIAGIIHKPFLNKTFWTLRDPTQDGLVQSRDLTDSLYIGQAARKDIKQTDSKLKIIVSRSHAGSIQGILEGGFGQRAAIIPAGGSGYKSLELVGGNVDAYVHITHIKKWDICAPYAILHAIPGGNLTTTRGEQIGFGNPTEKVVTDGLIATIDAGLHNQLIDTLGNSI